MKIAVINAGSSSLKFKLFNMESREVLDSKIVEHIGEKNSLVSSHLEAMKTLGVDFSKVDIVAHRVVHGGEYFHSPTLIDSDVKRKIKKLITLSPLHNRANLLGIEVAQKEAPHIPHIAIFDTSFHHSLPKVAYMYALDRELYKNHHIRRYGFHGSSHSYLLKQSAKLLGKRVEDTNIITLHLGNGASACAIQNGKSVDTSMGFTPLEGLVMGSRCGSIDPAIPIYMMRELGMSLEEVDNSLNKESGLYGIAKENDVRELLIRGDDSAKLALEMMVRAIQKVVGSYMAILPTVDALVFSGGVGENSTFIRDEVMNSSLLKDMKMLVIKTDEELEMATQSLELYRKNDV